MYQTKRLLENLYVLSKMMHFFIYLFIVFPAGYCDLEQSH